MSKAKICVQLYTVANQIDKLGVYETMRKIHQLGFSAVEASWMPMTPENVLELKRASEDFKIEIAAVSAVLEQKVPNAPGETLLNNFDKIVNDCKTLNSKYIRMAMIPFRILGYKDKTMEFVKEMEKMAERLTYEGISFYYHNHHYEFQKYDGVYLLDLMRENTTKLGFELDVHWIQRAGENPVKIIKRFKDRVDLLHLKDYRIGPISFTGSELEDDKRLGAKLSNLIQFAELGEGNLDLKAIIEAGLASGSKYLIIEQDLTYDKDSFDSLKISADGLRRLGYGDLF